MDWLLNVGSTETQELLSFFTGVEQPKSRVVARQSPLICARLVPWV